MMTSPVVYNVSLVNKLHFCGAFCKVMNVTLHETGRRSSQYILLPVFFDHSAHERLCAAQAEDDAVVVAHVTPNDETVRVFNEKGGGEYVAVVDRVCLNNGDISEHLRMHLQAVGDVHDAVGLDTHDDDVGRVEDSV